MSAALLLLLLIAGSVIGATIVFHSKGTTGAIPVSSIVGNVFFQNDALGYDDVLRLEIQHITTPPQGKTYRAWLQTSSSSLLPLGSLAVSNGTGTLLYPGDSTHSNLLSTLQSVVVTLENTTSNATSPKGRTVYQARMNAALLQYVKNMLYVTPGLDINKSVVAGLVDTFKSMNDKTWSIVDSIENTQDYSLVRRQAIRVIEMTDGTAYARSSGDLPANLTSLMNTKVGLLSSPTQPGYIDTLTTQLDKLQKVAGNNTTLLQHIQNVRNAIVDLRNWVKEIRAYDVQIVKAPVLNNPAIIDVALQLKEVTSYAYTGRTVPPNPGPLLTVGSAGAYQASIEAQYLAMLEVKRV